MSKHDMVAPELKVSAWLNTAKPLSLAALRGKVVAIHVFQMLCPGCVSKGLPQTAAIRALFPKEDVEVIGLHSVFEHHAVMTPEALEVFLHEYRVAYPVAIDMPSKRGPVPLTMEEYQLQGTPTLLLIDRQGRLRFKHFGNANDMLVGAMIGQLLQEPVAVPAQAGVQDGACSDEGCAIPA